MRPPLLLYSTNAHVGYAIAERFYGGVHYAWCSPVFDGTTAASHINIPPSSSPAGIYRNLWEETSRGELHSTSIPRASNGIKTGADAKLAAGVIDEGQYAEIIQIVQRASVREFRPVLYVIPYDRVAHGVTDVPVALRAHPLSVEFKVEALPRECFDVIELWR